MEEKIDSWLDEVVGEPKLLKEYRMAPDKQKWWAENTKTLEQYPGFKKYDKTFVPMKQRLLKSIGEKKDWDKASIAYRRDTAKELDTTVDELDKAWQEHKDDLKKQEEITQRTKEVEKWPWYKKLLASEYEKQRYINDPERSIFSDKGEWYNKGESVSDLIYGGAGAIADVIPGVGGTVLGPAVRGLRDVQHKVYDSPYQKDWGEIGKDVGSDLMFNVGTDLLPTALLRRGSRVGKNAAKETGSIVGDKLRKVDEYLEAKNAQKSIDDSVEQISKNTDAIDDPLQFHKEVSKMPEGPMKRDLESIDNNPLATSDDRFNAVLDWGIEYNRNKKGLGADDLFENGQITKQLQDVRPSVLAAEKQRIVGNTGVDAVTKALGAGATAWKTLGEPGVKLAQTTKGRGGKPKENEQVKENRWAQGYATFDEKKSPEYKEWFEKNTRIMMGLED